MSVKRLLLSVLGFFVVTSVTGASINSRIIGGSDASTNQFPWVVSVRVDLAHVCGGSIINQNFILTAGHCVSEISATPIESSRVTIRVGSINQFAGGQILKVNNITIHPSYGNFLHDIALLKLDSSIAFNDKVNKIELSKEDDVYEEGTIVDVTGWGLQINGGNPYKLQHAEMSVLSSPDCELQAGYGYDSVICLKHPENYGICRGDDGAGVTSDKKLIAVASFAFGSCGTKYPDVASKISYYKSWINSIIA